MELMMPCLYAFLACIAFSIIYHVSWKRIPLTCLGGALGWLVYLLLDFPSDVPKYFIATVVISVYSEIMARVCKVPVTLFLTTAVLPLVRGAACTTPWNIACAEKPVCSRKPGCTHWLWPALLRWEL